MTKKPKMAIVFYLEALGGCHNILQIYNMWGMPWDLGFLTNAKNEE